VPKPNESENRSAPSATEKCTRSAVSRTVGSAWPPPTVRLARLSTAHMSWCERASCGDAIGWVEDAGRANRGDSRASRLHRGHGFLVARVRLVLVSPGRRLGPQASLAAPANPLRARDASVVEPHEAGPRLSGLPHRRLTVCAHGWFADVLISPPRVASAVRPSVCRSAAATRSRPKYAGPNGVANVRWVDRHLSARLRTLRPWDDGARLQFETA
jgi:hypothetical protein